MRELALDCLVKALKCLVCWYEEMDLGKEQSIHGGPDDQPQLANGGSFSSVSDVIQVCLTARGSPLPTHGSNNDLGETTKRFDRIGH